MLDLRCTFSGSPSGALHHLILKQGTFIVCAIVAVRDLDVNDNIALQLYPSADAIVILNASTLALVRILAFWEVFPGMQHTKDNIRCVSVDSGMKIVSS
jgi:hypothetical protein